MKRFLVLLMGLGSINFAHTQGLVLFNNIASVVNAPVTNAAGQRIIGPGPYLADLFYSTDTNAGFNSLVPAGYNQPFSSLTGQGGGYFIGGTKALPVTGTILAQVRVWNTNHGATFQEAQAMDGEWGVSTPFTLTLSVPPAPPPYMTGLQGFQLHLDLGSGPLIVSGPKSKTVAIGSTATLDVQVVSPTPLSYQWFFNGTNSISGATAAVLTLTNVQTSHSGAYTVFVQNEVGSVTGQPATLTVLPALEVNLAAVLTLVGTVGSSNRIEYITVGSSNDWTALTTLVLTSSPQLYVDLSSIGQPLTALSIGSVALKKKAEG
jgi:hypothetical protein